MATERTVPDVPYVAGAVAGAAAYLVGYLVVYVWQQGNVREMLRGVNALLQLFGGEAIPAWVGVGWLFYNAHYVALQFPAFGGTASRNFVAAGDAPAALFAVPILALLVAGAAVAWWADREAVADGATAGGTVAVGYVVVAAVGLLAFRVSRGDATVAPDPVTGVLLAGVVYPVVFGAVGGAAAAALRATR